MTRQDWLLVFVCLPVSGQKARARLDPIRIMKGMFLFGQKSGLPVAEVYDFKPYLYGPCSFEIYGDLDSLVASGLIAEERPWGQSWSLYSPTISGDGKVSWLQRQFFHGTLDTMRSIKEFVVSKSFSDLLREIYKSYPEYATKSLFSLAPS